MREIEVQQGQSAIDIAIQEYGAAEGVFWLIEDNQSVESVETVPMPGKKLKIREIGIIGRNNIAIAKSLAQYMEKINTGNQESTTGYVEADYVDDNYVE